MVRCGRKQECRGLGGWVLARTSAPLLLQSLLLLLLMQSLPLQSLLLPHRRRRHRPAKFRPAVIDLCAHKVRITGGGSQRESARRRRENRRSLTDGQAERKRRGRQREPPVTRASSRRLWRRWRLRNSGLAVQNICTVLPSRSRQRLHSRLRYQPLVLHWLFFRRKVDSD